MGKHSKIIEITSLVKESAMKGFYSRFAILEVNGEKLEHETNFLSTNKDELQKLYVGFEWEGDYWGDFLTPPLKG